MNQVAEYGPGAQAEVLRVVRIIEHRADGTIGDAPRHGDVE